MKKYLQKFIELAGILFGLILLSFFVALVVQSFVSMFASENNIADAKLTMTLGLLGTILSTIQFSRVIYTQKEGNLKQEKEININEARFMLDYNQGFIQDANMAAVEKLLERDFEKKEKLVINESNRQNLINYLVYLEGLSPLILNNVMRLSNVDDLMAYRYFIAVNNEKLQKDQLFKYPQYYKGCFKLYKVWKKFREDHNEEIINKEHSLDNWFFFDYYASNEYIIRKANVEDDFQTIAKLIYDTDSYIYPAIFKNKSYAIAALEDAIRKENNLFSYQNIYVACKENEIVGACLLMPAQNKKYIETLFADRQFALSKNFNKVFNEYFKKQNPAEDEIFVLCLSVKEAYQKKHIGHQLLGCILEENKKQKKYTSLEVLIKNEAAIKLYTDAGLHKISKEYDGFSTSSDVPKAQRMSNRIEKKKVLS